MLKLFNFIKQCVEFDQYFIMQTMNNKLQLSLQNYTLNLLVIIIYSVSHQQNAYSHKVIFFNTSFFFFFFFLVFVVFVLFGGHHKL